MSDTREGKKLDYQQNLQNANSIQDQFFKKSSFISSLILKLFCQKKKSYNHKNSSKPSIHKYKTPNLNQILS